MDKQDRHTSPIDTLVHGLFRLPYRLNVRQKRIVNPLKPTYLFLHGLADTGGLWRPLLEKLPLDTNYIVLDLLGHGASKRPRRAVYSAAHQARHVYATCASLGIVGPLVIVGHSFGSLVAAELAAKHPLATQQLVLCAPPIYRPVESSDRSPEAVLRSIYRLVANSPQSARFAYDLAEKLNLVGFSKLHISKENLPALVDTLKSGIISQTAGKRLEKTHVPTAIIYGAFDPFLVSKNLKQLAIVNKNISVKSLPTAHSIQSLTVKTILKTLDVPL